MTASVPPRSAAWKWYVCVLLGLATTINYLDRQTLSAVSPRIIDEFHLSNEQYGNLETGFSLAFAVGTSLFGFIADRTSIRWLYPAVLVLWSMMGFSAGLVESYAGLFLCRTFLGLFEAGHWPCALKTTQWLLAPKERTMGNSILQNGTSIASIATPLLMGAMLTPELGSWRPVFQMIGLVGIVWVVLWIISVRSSDLRPAGDPEVNLHGSIDGAEATATAAAPTYWRLLFSRRFAVLMAMVAGINTCWHIFRVWLTLYLQKSLHYPEAEALYLTSFYYGATGAGCFFAGVATLWLNRRGMSAHRASARVFFFCALLTAVSIELPFLHHRWKVAALLLIGFGGLGLFPCYYAITQELSVRHQGKIVGLLGSLAWVVSAIVQTAFGRLIDLTSSYELGFVLAGAAPLLAYCVLLLFWGQDPEAHLEAEIAERAGFSRTTLPPPGAVGTSETP